jgi:4-amino-4-deoxy-L-arabinose transferase-like glycosyltransferase
MPPPIDRGIAPPAWLRRLWQTPWLGMALVVLLFGLPMFVGLGGTDLDNDEAIYAFAVETMLDDGDWLTPKSIPSFTRPFLEKPPLKFWITAAPLRLGWFPVNEFGLRALDALMGALTFVYVFLIGRRLAGPVGGLAAALLLFTHPTLLYNHGLRSNNMESTTTLAYAAGVFHFMAWRSINPDVKRHVYAMSLWFVLAFMTKFVAGLFLPVILGMAALMKHEDRGRLFRDWRTFAAAAGLAAALIVPWFVYQYVKIGPTVLDIMFGEHVFKRLTAYLDPSHLQPWHYYLTEIWAELGQAGTRILVVIGALMLAAKTWRRRWTEGAVVILWFAVPMAVISTGTSKLYHYAYPFIPPVALAGGFLVAYLARGIDRLLTPPSDSAARWRDSRLPGALKSQGVQIAVTIAGLAAIVVSIATAAFGRIHLDLGSTQIRNSSAVRPLLVAAVLWLAAAPVQVLRAAVVGTMLVLILPIATYRSNVALASRVHRPFQQVRECMAPIVAERVARGERAAGVYVETRFMSHIPFYYMRTFGAWNQRDSFSDAMVARYLLAPNSFRPVILSTQRYNEFMEKLTTNREPLVFQAAMQAGLDASVLEASIARSTLGLLVMPSETLILPGPYAPCGPMPISLVSR